MKTKRERSPKQSKPIVRPIAGEPLSRITAYIPLELETELRAISVLSGLRFDLVLAAALMSFAQTEFETTDDYSAGRLGATESRVREVQGLSLDLLRDPRYREADDREAIAAAAVHVGSLNGGDAAALRDAFNGTESEDASTTSASYPVSQVIKLALQLNDMDQTDRDTILAVPAVGPTGALPDEWTTNPRLKMPGSRLRHHRRRSKNPTPRRGARSSADHRRAG